MKNIVFQLLMLICTCCHHPEYDRRLQIANNSNIIIYVGISNMDWGYKDSAYVNFNYSVVKYGERYKFYPNTVKEYLLYIPWEQSFEHGKSDTVSFYVFDAAVLETTQWGKVKNDYLVLQRYDLNLENLINLNWTLSYPPDERMKNMKMYPPCGSK